MNEKDFALAALHSKHDIDAIEILGALPDWATGTHEGSSRYIIHMGAHPLTSLIQWIADTWRWSGEYTFRIHAIRQDGRGEFREIRNMTACQAVAGDMPGFKESSETLVSENGDRHERGHHWFMFFPLDPGPVCYVHRETSVMMMPYVPQEVRINLGDR